MTCRACEESRRKMRAVLAALRIRKPPQAAPVNKSKETGK